MTTLTIDLLEHLKAWFADYCRAFHTGNAVDDRNYDLKEEHTGRVCENIRGIAGEAGVGDDGMLLAEAIALFHDVGRFPQYRRYRTFKDADSANHAALGVTVLREKGVLDKLPKDKQDIVIRGVGLHNVFAIPEQLDAKSALFLKLIRDADKLDIWRVFIDYYRLPEAERASAAGLGFPDLAGYSPEVAACLDRREMVRLAMVRSLNDFKLLQLSWVFDLNFPASFRVIRERRLLEQLVATLPAEARESRAVASLFEFVAHRGGLFKHLQQSSVVKENE